MYNNKKITLLIPCYNEAAGLEKVLQKKPSFIDEVIVVDNNSDDATADIARQYGATALFLKKRGYGLAYQKGLSYPMSGDIIIMMDGDDSYPISEVEKILIYMETNNYDFVSGCRFPLPNKRAIPLVKRFSNYFISYLIRKCFRITLVDSQSGMIVFKSRLLKEILPLNSGMGFSQEIKLRAWLNPSIRNGELYINYYVRSGRAKFCPMRDGIKVLWDMLLFFDYVNRNKCSFSLFKK